MIFLKPYPQPLPLEGEGEGGGGWLEILCWKPNIFGIT